MQSVYRPSILNKELSQKAKLSIYWSIQSIHPTLTYGYELWVVTERTRSWIQAAKMSFFPRVATCSLRLRVRSSGTREELGIKPLVLPIKKSQLRWLGQMFQMPPGCFPREVFQACPTRRMPRGRPRTRWREYGKSLSRPGITPGYSWKIWASVWGEGLGCCLCDNWKKMRWDRMKFVWIASLFTYPIPDKHCFVGIFIGARATSHSLNTGHATRSNLIKIKELALHTYIHTGNARISIMMLLFGLLFFLHTYWWIWNSIIKIIEVQTFRLHPSYLNNL